MHLYRLAPLPVAAEPRLPLPFGSGQSLPLPRTGPLGPNEDVREVEGVAHEEEVGQHDDKVDAVHSDRSGLQAIRRLVHEDPEQQGDKERADQHQRLT
eukprot:scaffold80196_cov67-Phaeocystis_antarctica.AAC.4